ncbi:MAG: DUF397 domain-containing protein [Actinobacteria bacterium]|nr:DUF397 domain-containing protein [Actinomycetota bacterium]
MMTAPEPDGIVWQTSSYSAGEGNCVEVGWRTSSHSGTKRQLQKTIFQFDHTPCVVRKIDEDSAPLAAALDDATSKIVISTLHDVSVRPGRSPG